MKSVQIVFITFAYMHRHTFSVAEQIFFKENKSRALPDHNNPAAVWQISVEKTLSIDHELYKDFMS